MKGENFDNSMTDFYFFENDFAQLFSNGVINKIHHTHVVIYGSYNTTLKDDAIR